MSTRMLLFLLMSVTSTIARPLSHFDFGVGQICRDHLYNAVVSDPQEDAWRHQNFDLAALRCQFLALSQNCGADGVCADLLLLIDAEP